MPLDERIKKESILLFGPPGAGKTTIGRMLEENEDVRYLSLGETKRKLVSEQTRLGKTIARRKKKLSGNLVLRMVEYEAQRLVENGQYDQKKHALLIDGAPRYPEQMEVFDRYMSVSQILFFSMPIDVARERAKRRGSAGRGYDEKVFFGKIERLMGHTIPVMVTYASRGVPIHIIDANRPIGEVYYDAAMVLKYGKIG